MRRSLRVLAAVVFAVAATTWAHDGYSERREVMRLLGDLRDELRTRDDLSPQQLAQVRASLEQARQALLMQQHQPECENCGGAWGRREVIDACSAAFDGEAKMECMGLAARARFDAVSTIGACENDFDGDANELACLRAAVASRTDPTAAITACESAFDGDANELECVRVIAPARCDAAALVTACENAMDGDANELACVQAGVQVPRDPAGLVTVCDELSSGDEAELACIRQQRGEAHR